MRCWWHASSYPFITCTCPCCCCCFCCCCCCCFCMKLSGLYSSTPAALTALSDTSFIRLSTLPQVLGVLAFVYAGEGTYQPLRCVCCHCVVSDGPLLHSPQSITARAWCPQHQHATAGSNTWCSCTTRRRPGGQPCSCSYQLSKEQIWGYSCKYHLCHMKSQLHQREGTWGVTCLAELVMYLQTHPLSWFNPCLQHTQLFCFHSCFQRPWS